MSEQAGQLKRAYQLLRSGERDKAIKLIKEVLKANKRNASAWWLLANAVDDPNQAKKALQNVLKLRPDDPKATKMLAELEAGGGGRSASYTPESSRRRLNVPLILAGVLVMALIVALVVAFILPSLQGDGEIDRPDRLGECTTVPDPETTPDPNAPDAPVDDSPFVVCEMLEVGDLWTGFLQAGEQHNWTFEGQAGQNLTVEVNAIIESEDGLGLDTYLELLNQAGEVLAADDDSGPNVNSLLLVTLPTAQTYTWRVRDLQDDSEGRYEIWVREE